MKKNTISSILALTLGGVCLALGQATVHAGDGKTGPYFSTDVGVSLVDDISVSLDDVSGKVSLDPGVRFDIGGGYRFYSSSKVTVGLELETGIIYNSLDKAMADGDSASVEGDFLQVPFLGNVVLTLEPSEKWVAYLGAGGGGVFGQISIDSVGGDPVGVTGDETDPAVQGMAGVRYKINDNSEIGIGYKFLETFPDGINHIITHTAGIIYTLHF